MKNRKDAIKVKDIHGMQNILIDLAPKRSESEVYMNTKIDVTKFCNFIDDLKKEHSNITYFHGMTFVLAKTIYSRPLLNRFIKNRTMYEHKNVSLGFVAKTEFEDKAVEFLTVIPINKKDNLINISNYISKKINKIREKSNKKGDDIDKVANFIGKLPKIFRVPIVGILKFLDNHGLLPKEMIEGNVYYSSGILSNLGTFKVNPIYHHLVEFGTCSTVVTFGEIKEENNKKTLEIGVTIDERIADGFYFCKALKLIEHIFENPQLLLEEANKKVSIKIK